jgi:hypothetical protein
MISARCQPQDELVSEGRKAHCLLQYQVTPVDEIVPLRLGTHSAFSAHEHLHVAMLSIKFAVLFVAMPRCRGTEEAAAEFAWAQEIGRLTGQAGVGV